MKKKKETKRKKRRIYGAVPSPSSRVKGYETTDRRQRKNNDYFKERRIREKQRCQWDVEESIDNENKADESGRDANTRRNIPQKKNKNKNKADE